MKVVLYILFYLCASFTTFGQRLEIYGFIFSKPDSLPIHQAEVSLYSEKDSLIETISSDEKGKFIFKKVGSGIYYVEVRKKTYGVRKINNLKITGMPNCALRIPLEKEIK